MHEGVRENPSVVRVGRSRHANVRPERVGQEDPRERRGPVGGVDVGVVVDLVEVIAAVVVGVFDQRAHHVRRRVLRARAKQKTKRKDGGASKQEGGVLISVGGGGG